MPAIHFAWNPKHVIVQWVGIGKHTFNDNNNFAVKSMIMLKLIGGKIAVLLGAAWNRGLLWTDHVCEIMGSSPGDVGEVPRKKECMVHLKKFSLQKVPL